MYKTHLKKLYKTFRRLYKSKGSGISKRVFKVPAQAGYFPYSASMALLQPSNVPPMIIEKKKIKFKRDIRHLGVVIRSGEEKYRALS